VRVTFWGTRGSVATPGPETVGYGGDTACVGVEGDALHHQLILDAGTGIRRLGASMADHVTEVDLLLTHLHLDHIIGLGFFAPMFRADLNLRIWAPPATTSLLERLGRYLSPPLFPVRLRDVACNLEMRETPDGAFSCGEFTVRSEFVIHPDPAVGYRIESDGVSLAYLPDHEPALSPDFPAIPNWTSGTTLAQEVDVLVHDAQYTPAEYLEHIGWGHSSVDDAVRFADLVRARTLALFHHDPSHDDGAIDQMRQAGERLSRGVTVSAASEGSTLEV
jgi:phosphoribosyl 1,2-cyclic phosphodiesterase